MVHFFKYETREQWLKKRTSYIGGSDAACILGLNPWKTNVQLWEEKTGRAVPADISDNPFVQYGTKAEAHLRELFALDFPEYRVEYAENNMTTNDSFPWAHASLDGFLIEKETGRLGILEIKTTTIMHAGQMDKWKDRIPDNYFCQLLHYFAVTEASFAVLKAQLKYERDGVSLTTKHYKIEREEVEDDIRYLMEQEEIFARNITTDTRPSLILPKI